MGMEVELDWNPAIRNLRKKYDDETIAEAFAQEMRLHADEVSAEQIEKIIQNIKEERGEK